MHIKWFIISSARSTWCTFPCSQQRQQQPSCVCVLGRGWGLESGTPEFESYFHLFVTSDKLFCFFEPPSLGNEARMSFPWAILRIKRDNVGTSSQLCIKHCGMWIRIFFKVLTAFRTFLYLVNIYQVPMMSWTVFYELPKQLWTK